MAALAFLLAAASAVSAPGLAPQPSAERPHLVFLLTDDLGYNSPGYRNADLHTPALDSLAADGLKLEEYYVYMYCAPTRGAFHTGRFPYHLDAVQKNLIPWSMPAGIDLRYDFLPKILKRANYSTHHIGKWHQGFFRAEYTPLGRGYDSTYGFLVGGEDHYTQDASWSVNCSEPSRDLSRGNLTHGLMPCYGENGTAGPHSSGDDNHYNGFTFTAEAVAIIESFAAARQKESEGIGSAAAGDVDAGSSERLFIYFALHNTHSPVEAPLRIQSLYTKFAAWPKQQVFNAMVSSVDESALNVSVALKRSGLWANTLFIWSTDNGSPVSVAGTNAPLKGGKGSNWEGGTRVPCFIAGGFLPAPQRGKSYKTGMAHVIDWYRTFATLAGADALADHGSAPAALDSVDLWPWLSGAVAHSPRNEVIYDHRMNTTDRLWNTSHLPGYASGALRVGKWKLMVGPQSQASWYGHFTPNASACGPNASSPPTHLGGGKCPDISTKACQSQPCLFDMLADKTEHEDKAASEPEALAQLLARWAEVSLEYHPPPNPNLEEAEYCAAITANRGFVAPWHHA